MNFKNCWVLGLPWILCQTLSHHPVWSYFIAYLGSFFIFYITILSPAKLLSSKQPLSLQVMKPIVLIQLIFAGFMCCTSIFYLMDHLGCSYFNNGTNPVFQINTQTFLIAKCQRLVLLGHLGLVLGIQSQLQASLKPKYNLTIPLSGLLIKISIISALFAMIFGALPGLIQIKYYLLSISTTCGAYLLLTGFAEKRFRIAVLGGLIFGSHILNSTLTGYKEGLIVSFINLSFLAFPYFKKTVIIFFFPGLLLLLYCLPTLTVIIRKESWIGNKTAKAAREEAYELFLSGNHEDLIASNNREFLTNRLSETKMFTQYVSMVPDQRPYYAFEILKNSIFALVPRVMWSQKPNTEKVAMERVYDCGVVNRQSVVSAKTRPVTDGYLSGGAVMVLLAMFLYGRITQWLANKAELLFDGYLFGCTIIFNSIFQCLWRGSNWEFLLNNIVYGYLLMLLIFYILKYSNLLTKNDYDKDYTDHPIL